MEPAAVERFLTDAGFAGGGDEATRSLLVPFFDIAETGRYALAPSSALEQARIAEAVSRAGGVPVDAVTTLSCDDLSRAPWGSRRRIAREHGAVLRDGLWLRIWAVAGPPFDVTVGGWEGHRDLSAAFHAGLGQALRTAFFRRIEPALGYDLCLHGWNTVEEGLTYWLGFSRAGDIANAARLAPLVGLLPYAVPLSAKAGFPGAWTVLVG
jgi:hypothetical protein